jgi:hypothetical protein
VGGVPVRVAAPSVPPLIVADVVRAWSAWAAPHSGLSLAAREHLARVLEEMLTEYLMSDEHRKLPFGRE